MLKRHRITVIIPAYNEAGRIGGVLSRIPDFVDEVIVVDDGSSDSTSEVAEAYGARVIRLERNRGKGAAMKAGVDNSSGDIIVFMDADGQHRPEEILKLVEPIVNDEADFVIGARRIEAQGKRPLHRRLSNIITTRLLRLKLKSHVYDTQSGFRAIRREFMPEIETKRYEVETEVLIKAVRKGARVREVPVSMIYGVETGHFRLEDVFRFLWALLRF